MTTPSDIWDRAISPFLRLEPESNSERVRHTYTRAEASWRRVNEIPPHAPATFQRHRPCWTFSSARLTPRILEIHRRVTRRCPPVESTRSINGTVRRKRTGRFRCSISGKYPLVSSDSPVRFHRGWQNNPTIKRHRYWRGSMNPWIFPPIDRSYCRHVITRMGLLFNGSNRERSMRNFKLVTREWIEREYEIEK